MHIIANRKPFNPHDRIVLPSKTVYLTVRDFTGSHVRWESLPQHSVLYADPQSSDRFNLAKAVLEIAPAREIKWFTNSASIGYLSQLVEHLGKGHFETGQIVKCLSANGDLSAAGAMIVVIDGADSIPRSKLVALLSTCEDARRIEVHHHNTSGFRESVAPQVEFADVQPI